MSSVGVGGFHHEALLYDGIEGFERGALPFIHEAVAARAPVLVVVDVPKIDRLRAALGADGDAVTFADMDQVGRNPARILPAWHEFVDRHGRSHPRLWGLGEPLSAARDADELVECHRHEALLNEAFPAVGDGPTLSLLCPYDVAALPDAVVADAGRTHPWLRHGDRRWASDGFGPDDVADDLLTRPLPPPTCDVRQLSFDVRSLRRVRELVRAHATPVLGPARTEDLVLAVNEVAANSVLHGGGVGVARVWHDRRGIACEVSDVGRLDQPLAGRVRPRPTQPHGRGLWIVNQLCDLVQVRSHPGGSTVRLRMDRPR